MIADPSLESAFVAFAIGRTAGPAVERNRARRRLREILRSLDPAPGLYLFGLSVEARRTTFESLRTAVQAVIDRQSGALRTSGADVGRS